MISNTINKRQIAAVHTVANKLGVPRMIYEDILREQAGVESSKDLTREDFERVMRAFQSIGRERGVEIYLPSSGWKGSGKKKWVRKPVPGSRVGGPASAAGRQFVEMATPEQQQKLLALWSDVARIPNVHALTKFLQKRFGIAAWEWLDKKTAISAIEALKKMRERQSPRPGMGG